ncbi:MAG: efflux RND transporter periplasmic adaptor subunit [Blastocatellia bacterium]|nr:efflux RND transporter periplasmic adaptor subunit [Blastocatellia bacterium]
MKLKFNQKQLIITAIGVILVGGTGGYLIWGRRASTEEYITAKVERGAIRNTVSATGTLQAVTTVQVGSQVSGTISELYADFNTIVKKGQVVAQLDPRVLQAQLTSQEANLEQARASLADAKAKELAAEATIDNLRAGVSSADANLAALKAQRDDTQSLLRRQEGLAQSGLIPDRDLEASRSNYNAAEARYKQAVAQLDQAKVSEKMSASSGLAQAKAQVKLAEAQIQQIQSALEMAKVNLSYTTITSPIDGIVVARSVDKGQTVAASLQAPTLFTIANDLTQMQVIANIDQADIGVINQTNRVSFTVDAFPGHNFGGTINQIRLSPQNVQNVITYNVVIDVQNPELKLKPGMTANLTLTIAEREDTLKIPNAALRFRPQGMTPEKMRELFGGGAQAGRGARTEAGKGGAKDAEGKDQGQSAGGERKHQGARGNQADGQQGAPDGSRRAGAGPVAANGPGGAERRSQPGKGAPSGPGVAATPPVPSTTPIQEGQVRWVWVLGADNKPQPRKVKLGITDGTSTEVVEGDLKEGEIIIVAQNISAEDRQNSQQRAPGFGGGPGGGPRGGGFGGGGPRR